MWDKLPNQTPAVPPSFKSTSAEGGGPHACAALGEDPQRGCRAVQPRLCREARGPARGGLKSNLRPSTHDDVSFDAFMASCQDGDPTGGPPPARPPAPAPSRKSPPRGPPGSADDPPDDPASAARRAHFQRDYAALNLAQEVMPHERWQGLGSRREEARKRHLPNSLGLPMYLGLVKGLQDGDRARGVMYDAWLW